MKATQLYTQILGIEKPWRINDVQVSLADDRVEVTAEHRGGRLTCPECGKAVPDYDSQRRSWWLLDTCQLKTQLTARVPRVKCPEHGVLMVRVPWVEPNSRSTAMIEPPSPVIKPDFRKNRQRRKSREFKLPGIHELSKEQEDVRNRPPEGRHLIVGGPGTGKSVLALLRAKRLYDEEKTYCFLVYNHLLNQSTQQLSEIQLVSSTWIKWFKRTFREIIGQDAPILGGKPWNIDWEQAMEIIQNSEMTDASDLPYLVIDEGQDMPPKFYRCLAELGFENFFVMADQNQQITNEHSSIADLRNALALEPKDVIELTKNYRNSYPVARLAREFYTGDPASPPPELPGNPGEVDTPILFKYSPNKFNQAVNRIAKRADQDPTKLIGIIAFKNVVSKSFYDALKKITDGFDNAPPKISIFSGENRTEMKFDEGGIMVINAQSCKGLEFDECFIVGLCDFWDHSDDLLKKLFYVMVARAKDRVFILKEDRGDNGNCQAESILPEDEEILKRITSVEAG